MKNITWLKELNKNSIGIAGGKGAQLGEMYNNDFPVPAAFVVTAQAYKEFLQMTQLDVKINQILKNLNVDNTKQLTIASKKIKELILKEELATTLKQQITEAYDNLNVDEKVLKAGKNVLDLIKHGRGNAFVAVRSSATAEDLPQASFAGQQETYLNIRGEKNLLNSVKKCWASLFTPRAIFYREKNNFPHDKVLIAVIIQKMVNSETAGVIFSVNPATNNKNEILIEAGFGLGEVVVSGSINPDLYILDKETLNLEKKEIKKQKFKIIRDESTGQNIKKKILEEEQEKQVLTEQEISKLGNLAKRLEEHYKKPQDIEFAIERSKVYIVQSRPVTTLKEEVKGEKLKGEALTQGLAASPGIVSGIVKLIKNKEEIHNFPEKGHVLVTTMTNPSMVPIMKKAVGIVTDEGGISSHASIVSRELGIPCIVGTENATTILEDGLIVTVDAINGKVYKGEIKKYMEKPKTEILDKAEGITTKTKIYMNLGEPEKIDVYKDLNFDGIGLMRIEFIIAGEIGIHPNYLIKQNKQQEYIDKLVKGIEKVASNINSKPIIVRFSDFKTNEYRDLKGGEEFEEKEDNPMLGWRGISRYISDEFKEAFKLECKAIKKVREKFKNVHVMLPFVRNVNEVEKVLEIMKQEGLERGEEFKIALMAEVPSIVFLADKFCKYCDLFSCGSNDLTQLILGVDRDSEKLGKMGYFDERNPAVLRAIKKLIKVAHNNNVKVSICGQAPSSSSEIVEFLVKNKIDSISVNPDAVGKVRRQVAKIEENNKNSI